MSNNFKTIEILIRTLFILIFITFKLCNIVDWSWWWVFCPVWIPAISYVLWLCDIYGINSRERARRQEREKEKEEEEEEEEELKEIKELLKKRELRLLEKKLRSEFNEANIDITT